MSGDNVLRYFVKASKSEYPLPGFIYPINYGTKGCKSCDCSLGVKCCRDTSDYGADSIETCDSDGTDNYDNAMLISTEEHRCTDRVECYDGCGKNGWGATCVSVAKGAYADGELEIALAPFLCPDLGDVKAKSASVRIPSTGLIDGTAGGGTKHDTDDIRQVNCIYPAFTETNKINDKFVTDYYKYWVSDDHTERTRVPDTVDTWTSQIRKFLTSKLALSAENIDTNSTAYYGVLGTIEVDDDGVIAEIDLTEDNSHYHWWEQILPSYCQQILEDDGSTCPDDETLIYANDTTFYSELLDDGTKKPYYTSKTGRMSKCSYLYKKNFTYSSGIVNSVCYDAWAGLGGTFDSEATAILGKIAARDDVFNPDETEKYDLTAPTGFAEFACPNYAAYPDYKYITSLETEPSCAEDLSTLCIAESNVKCWWKPCYNAMMAVDATTVTQFTYSPLDTQEGCSCEICANITCADSGGTVTGDVVQTTDCTNESTVTCVLPDHAVWSKTEPVPKDDYDMNYIKLLVDIDDPKLECIVFGPGSSIDIALLDLYKYYHPSDDATDITFSSYANSKDVCNLLISVPLKEIEGISLTCEYLPTDSCYNKWHGRYSYPNTSDTAEWKYLGYYEEAGDTYAFKTSTTFPSFNADKARILSFQLILTDDAYNEGDEDELPYWVIILIALFGVIILFLIIFLPCYYAVKKYKKKI